VHLPDGILPYARKGFKCFLSSHVSMGSPWSAIGCVCRGGSVLLGDRRRWGRDVVAFLSSRGGEEFVTRWIRLVCLLAIGSCAANVSEVSAAESAAGSDVPNIILIIGDDHGWPYFGFMGDEIVKTPHLDALAKEGVLFPFGFTTSSTCRPSLRSLLTGLDPVQWRAKRRAHLAKGQSSKGRERIRDFETLPRRLARRGYASFQGGKYWEGGYQAGGFTDGMARSLDAASLTKWGWMQGRAGGDSLELGRTTMEPLWDFLEKNRDEPFFVWFAPKLPHTPHDASEEFLALYAGDDLSESARKYYANISRFDARVGELVARLEKLGLREKTLIVYLTDNGWEQDPRATYRTSQLGGPKGKSSMYELGFRTPIIFNWPGRLTGGTRRDDLVSEVDLFTTMLEFAELEPPPDRTGVSLRSALLGDGKSSRETVIGSMRRLRPPRNVESAKAGLGEDLVRTERAYFLRTDSWRYIWYSQSKRYGDRVSEELYRIDVDPREEHNVVRANPKLAKQFRHEIRRWIEKANARTKSPS
jgi:uncharacterized sulfatase